MKNLKKLNRENLKNLIGGSDTCSYCGISQICATGCFGEPICLPRGPYFPTDC